MMQTLRSLELQRPSEMLRHEISMIVDSFTTSDIEMTSKVALLYILYKYHIAYFSHLILPQPHVIDLLKM